MKYRKNCLLTIACISLAGLVACGEERQPTEQEFNEAKAWQACAQQEKWDKAYKQVGTIGTRIAIRNECGAKPPFVPDD